jgi:hypothetical protein
MRRTALDVMMLVNHAIARIACDHRDGPLGRLVTAYRLGWTLSDCGKEFQIALEKQLRSIANKTCNNMLLS